MQNLNSNNHDMGYRNSYPESRNIEVVDRNQISFQTLLRASLKRPWVVITAFIMVVVPLLYYVYNQSSVYQSLAYISIPTGGKGSALSQSAEGYLFNESAGGEEFITSMLGSYNFKQMMIKDMTAALPDVSPDSIRRSVNSGYSFAKKPRVIGFITLYGKSESPQMAYTIASYALSTLETLLSEQKRTDASYVVEYVDKVLIELNQDIEELEYKIQQFLEQRGLRTADLLGGEGGEIRTLENKLTEAETSRDMIKLQLDNYNRLIVNHLDNIFANVQDEGTRRTSTSKRSELEELNSMISDSMTAHADTLAFQRMLEKRKQLVSELVETSSTRSSLDPNADGQMLRISVRNLETQLQDLMISYEEAQIKCKYFQSQIAAFNAKHPNLSNDVLEYRNMARSRDVLRRTIDILIEKREGARIGTASEGTGIRIIDDPRLPTSPLPSNRSRNIILGLILALGLGLGIAYLIEFFDTTVQSENDITDRFGLSVFGSVPVLDLRMWKGKGKRSLQVELDKAPDLNLTLLKYHSESSPVAEAYRSLRTALSFATRERTQKTLVLSSSVASEGKSLTSHNICTSFAQSGMQVLLIDADLRRASQHKLAAVVREPGLSNLLLGECSFEETLRPLDQPNLTLMPAGDRVNNPADLLASKRMEEIIKDAESRFDLVLIDTPPISPCMDSRNIANLVGGMVLVVRAEMTKMPILEHCVNLCRKVDVNLQGVIINHVSFRYSYGYYYIYQRNNPYGYYYYYSGYSYYYNQDPETGERTKERVKKKKKHRQADHA